MTADRNTVALVSGPVVDLVPGNPKVAAIATKLRWSNETVIRRVSKALPAIVEQRLYLQLAESYRIMPETMAKMLMIFRGGNELKSYDLEKREVGKNLFLSRFDQVVEKLEVALGLMDKVSDSAEFAVGALPMARLVESYGAHAEDVMSQIIENVDVVAECLRLRPTMGARKIVGVALTILIEENIPDHHDRGRVDPIDIEEMLERRQEPRRGGRR